LLILMNGDPVKAGQPVSGFYPAGRLPAFQEPAAIRV